MSNDKKNTNRKISLIITSIYVGLGTIYSLVYWTNSAVELESFGQFIFYFFLPVSFLSIAFIFTLREPFIAILIGQLISFFIVWGPIHFIVTLIKKLLT